MPTMVPQWYAAVIQWLGISISPEVALVLWGGVLFTLVAVLGKAAVIFMVLMERKVLAWLTQRKGPNRVGPFGVLQTLADGVKLLFKEDIMHANQDKWLFTLGPAIFFLPVFVILALIPFTDMLTGVSLPAGALFIFALSSISVIGMVMSGWGSANKYSLIGGMRSAAQAISYEIPLILSVLAVVLFTGSMDLNSIVQAQKGGALSWLWFSITPISFIIFLISSTAEVNRIPFDLPESESELVSGYNTEYTGMKFALFFLAEYAALFGMCALTVIFFFGGYYSPFGGLLTETFGIGQAAEQAIHLPGFAALIGQLEMVIWMISKMYVFVFLAMWIRGTLPRLKPDQLMAFSWKFLIPLSLLNLVFVTLEKYAMITQGISAWILWAVVLIVGMGWFVTWYSNRFTRQLQARLRPL